MASEEMFILVGEETFIVEMYVSTSIWCADMCFHNTYREQ